MVRREDRRRNLSDFLVSSVLMGLVRNDPLQKEKEKKKDLARSFLKLLFVRLLIPLSIVFFPLEFKKFLIPTTSHPKLLIYRSWPCVGQLVTGFTSSTAFAAVAPHEDLPKL